MTITEFLEARIAEDEAVARECLLPKNLVPYGDDRIPAIKPEEWGSLVDNYLGGPMGKHCARHDPARVLAECAAKRAIVAMGRWAVLSGHTTGDNCGLSDQDTHNTAMVGLEVLAVISSVYSSHPDYRQEWAPRG